MEDGIAGVARLVSMDDGRLQHAWRPTGLLETLHRTARNVNHLQKTYIIYIYREREREN